MVICHKIAFSERCGFVINVVVGNGVENFILDAVVFVLYLVFYNKGHVIKWQG